MKIWSGLCIAFGMYSRIPVPRVDWKEENMKYCMCFFPLVGLVLGMLLAGILKLAGMIMLPAGITAAFCTTLPVLVTGGIHLDGYLDTKDALASCGDREKKLAILKDSHVGAFAVIGCVIYFILQYSAWISFGGRGLLAVCSSFVISRALSGLSVVTFPLAKNSGFVSMFSNAAQKNAVRISMYVYLLAAAVVVCVTAPVYGIIVMTVCGATYAYYYRMSVKWFGGITGDLAGYFVTLAELLSVLAVVIAGAVG